jgi:hypothetical protein
MRFTFFARCPFIAFVLLAPTQIRSSVATENFVQWAASAGAFPVVNDAGPCAVQVDANDWPGVLRAADDLKADIKAVTGQSPQISNAQKAVSSRSIIVGTLGKGELIDGWVEKGRIDVSAIRGKWESYLIQVVTKPVAGVDSALVIVGSDKRGTIYGIYDLSREIGVSPWYWWADVPTAHHDNIFIKPGKYTEGPPAVKYRGIFLNDEAPALSGWVREKYGQAKQSQDPASRQLPLARNVEQRL